jgi:hypothetical protein
MANFHVNPLAFLPEGMAIDQWPLDRKVLTNLVVPVVAPLQHYRVLVAETNRFIHIQQREQMRKDLMDLLVEEGHILRHYDDLPFGHAVDGLTYELDEITTI